MHNFPSCLLSTSNAVLLCILRLGYGSTRVSGDSRIVFSSLTKICNGLQDLDAEAEKERERKERVAAAESEFDKIQVARKDLPMFKYREQLLLAIEEHQILIIVGETGSGKTTQVGLQLIASGSITWKSSFTCQG